MIDELLAGQLAARLRRVRLERGLTLRQAAERTGVTKETLSDLERARRQPHPPTLQKIAEGYGVEIRDLLGPMVEEEPALAGKAEAPGEAGHTPHEKLVGKALELAETQGGELAHHYEALPHENLVQQYENLILAAVQRIEAGESQEAVVRKYAGFLEKMSRVAGEIGLQVGMSSLAPGESNANDVHRRALFGSWAHFLTFKNEEWLKFLDELPEPPEPEEFKRGRAVIEEMSSTFGAMMTGLSNYDVIDEVGRFAEARHAGETIPDAFDEEHGLLHGELEVWIYQVIPKARNWSTRFDERVELLEQLEERTEKWAQELKLQSQQ